MWSEIHSESLSKLWLLDTVCLLHPEICCRVNSAKMSNVCLLHILCCGCSCSPARSLCSIRCPLLNPRVLSGRALVRCRSSLWTLVAAEWWEWFCMKWRDEMWTIENFNNSELCPTRHDKPRSLWSPSSIDSRMKDIFTAVIVSYLRNWQRCTMWVWNVNTLWRSP